MKEYLEIKKIDLKSAVKFSLIIGFLFGLIFAVYMILWSFFTATPEDAQIMITYEGFLGNFKAPRRIFLLAFPFVSSFGFLVWGLIFSCLHNFIAKKFGGLKILFNKFLSDS
ncbi:MAG: hypothetical protein SWE60_08115 [Thermodesulfobacteriota bacterium]|nr:hypothetical protein [Thermodesulfobacteriota bacterium]